MFKFFFLLCSFFTSDVLGSSLVHPRAKDVVQNLYISNPYHDAGAWGNIELCADAGFVKSIEVKYSPQGHLDETAINGIKLYCADETTHYDTGYITSSTGTHGDWQGINSCTSDFVTGFRASVLKYQGVFTDDVAVENFKVECNYGNEVLEGLPFNVPDLINIQRNIAYDFKNGTWSNWAKCDAGNAVCGLQTKYEDGSLGDETSICDMVLFCCPRTI